MVLIALGAGCGPSPVDRLQARLALKEGNRSYLAGHYRAAITHYDRALAHIPTQAEPYLNRAYSQVALFRNSSDRAASRQLADSAIASFQGYLQRIEARPDDFHGPGRERIEQHILTLYLESEQPDQMFAFLREKLQRNPRDVSTLAMLANLALERGDIDPALDLQRQRLEIEPGSPEAHYALGVAIWKCSYYDKVPPEKRQVLVDEGLRTMLRAVEQRPDYFEALVYVNLLYRECAKHAQSEAERATFELKYKEYEARAQQVRQAQNGASKVLAVGK